MESRPTYTPGHPLRINHSRLLLELQHHCADPALLQESSFVKSRYPTAMVTRYILHRLSSHQSNVFWRTIPADPKEGKTTYRELSLTSCATLNSIRTRSVTCGIFLDTPLKDRKDL